MYTGMIIAACQKLASFRAYGKNQAIRSKSPSRECPVAYWPNPLKRTGEPPRARETA
jgi:hypothetical protein